MIRSCKYFATKIITVSVLVILLATSCENKKQKSAVTISDKPVVLLELSHDDSKLNDINSPKINLRKPDNLSISFLGGNTVDSPLYFLYSLPMVHQDSLFLKNYPNIQFEPNIKGHFNWESPTKLVFQPESGELNYGEYLMIKIDSAVPMQGVAYALQHPWQNVYIVPYFKMAGKIASWPVIKGAPKFISFLNWRSGEIGNGPVYLLYDQAIDITEIGQNIEILSADGQKLKYSIFRPKKIDMVYDGDVDLQYIIGLQVQNLPGEREEISVQLPQWNSDKEIYLSDYGLRVKKDFKYLKAYVNNIWSKYEYVPLQTNWNITFSNWVSIAQFKKSFTISPKPKSIHFSNSAIYDYFDGSNDYNSLSTVRLELEPGTNYKISVNDDLIDILGNKIEGKFDTTFRSVDLKPILELPREAILIEKGITKFPVRTQNLTSIVGELYKFKSAEQFAKALLLGKRTDPDDYGVKSSENKVIITSKNSKQNTVEILNVDLNGNSGLFCVKVSAQGTGSQGADTLSDLVLVQSSDIGITSKVYEGGIFIWITSLEKATPIDSLKVKLFDGDKVVDEGITDQNGVVKFEDKDLLTSDYLKKPLIVIAGEEKNAAVAKLDNKEFSNAWQFGLHGKVRGYNPLYAVVFTERGVYRPGETVHLKVILGGHESKSAHVKINDPRGQQLLNKELNLDEFHSASIDIKLKEQASVGEYNISISTGSHSTTRTFKVEEYRVPTFQVNVSAENKEWNLNESIEASIEAKYLHGGKLDGREVKWMVSRMAIPFSSKAFPQYIFSWNKGLNYNGIVISGNKRLDAQGNLHVSFTPDHPPSVGAMRYTVEGTVTDIDRQTYAGRVSKIIHPADFYIGLRPPSRSILSEGEKLRLPIVALSPEGKIVEGVNVKVLLERIDHHTAARISSGGNVQMLNRPEPVKVHYYEIKTGSTATVAEFDLAEAGQYRINAWSEDKDEKLVQVGFEFTVSGNNPTAWPRFDQERIDIVADKETYKMGEEAKIIVQSPYETATGILTIERDSVISYRLFEITKNTPQIKIPIEKDFAPNVFVSIVLIRGRMHHEKDASGFETGAPGLKIGYTNLRVEPEHKHLNVKTILDKTTAIPGEEIQIDLSVSDINNLPVEGQVTLMLVDEAVLGLTGYQTPDPLAQLYAEQLLGIRTGSNLLDLPHAKRSRLEMIFPGGDMNEGELQARFPAELRNLFESTAYYNPNVLLDKTGNAKVTIELPDNLTTFRVMAIAVDRDLRVGANDAQVEVRQPLMVQPVLPRFVYPDDELSIEALVYNGTNKSGKVKLIAEFEGLELSSGGLSRSIEINSNSTGTVAFPVKISKGDEIIVRYAASNGEFTDAVEVKIPILEPGTKRNIIENKRVTGKDKISLTVPAKHIKGSTKMEIVLSTTNLSELKDAVQYLMRYPNGCIEQTTSTAYPLVVLKDLIPEIGIDVDMEDLKKFSEAGVRRILSFQTPTGGLSYWPGSDQPHAFATAFGLTALIEAKNKGYDVSDEALEGMADYLEKSLREGKISDEMPHGGMADADTRALFVMTLGRLGRPQPGYISILWEKRDELTPFGLSFLAIAVKENPGDKSLLQPILAKIKEAANQDSEQAWYGGKPSGGWSFDSPLRTHASALLAFATADMGDEMTTKYLNGLLSRRRGGMWGNTQENVFGIMGVYESSVNKVGKSSPSMILKVNDKTYDDSQMEKNSKQVKRLNLVEDDLIITDTTDSEQVVHLTNQGGTPIIFTVRLQYDVPLSPENMKEQSNGFIIQRKYETLNGESLEGKVIKLGSLVRVRVYVKTDKAHHYVVIDDKLPAGLEPLNTSLSTTEKVSQGKLTNIAQRSMSVLSYSEIRDSRVAFYVDEILPGEYEFTYVARATTPGKYLRPSGLVEAMYQPEIFGRTATDYITIAE